MAHNTYQVLDEAWAALGTMVFPGDPMGAQSQSGTGWQSLSQFMADLGISLVLLPCLASTFPAMPLWTDHVSSGFLQRASRARAR